MRGDIDYDIVIKIVLMGNTSVGKTNLIQQYTKGYAIENQPPTIGMDFLSKEITLNGRNLKVQYWDTAGQEKYRSITHTYFKVAQGIVLVYDVTNRESFEGLDYWVQEIKENCDKNIQVVIIGNKVDLINAREVSTQEAKDFAIEHNYKYFETSALHDEEQNVKQAFDTLLNDTAEIEEQKQNKQLQQQKKTLKENTVLLKTKKESKKNCCQLIMPQIDQKYILLNESQKPKNQVACFFLLTSSMIGIGFLTLPYHVRQTGTILGSILIFLSGFCCLYGGFLITRVFVKIKNKNFNKLIKKNLGFYYEIVFSIDVILYLGFTTTVYFIFGFLISRQNISRYYQTYEFEV